MIEVYGNLWTYPADIRIITTNGSVKNNGEAVMGRGCAYEASFKFPKLKKELGKNLSYFNPFYPNGKRNRVYFFEQYKLITFPVKHLWMEIADIELIKESVKQLKLIIEPDSIYVMPRPGCGNGHLDWESQVKHFLINELPNNVRVITFAKEE